MQSTLTPEELEEFRNLVRDYYAAWSPGRNLFDISVAERFYSKGADLTAYDVFPTQGAIVGWENYKAELTRIMDGFQEFTLILNKEDIQVFRRGDITWTTSDFKIRATLKNGQSVEGVGRNTLVWEQQDSGGWLIVHEHSSSPLEN